MEGEHGGRGIVREKGTVRETDGEKGRIELIVDCERLR